MNGQRVGYIREIAYAIEWTVKNASFIAAILYTHPNG